MGGGKKGKAGREKANQQMAGLMVVVVIASSPVQVKTVGQVPIRSGALVLACSALCCCKLQVAVRKAGRPGEVSLFSSAGSAGSAASARL